MCLSVSSLVIIIVIVARMLCASVVIANVLCDLFPTIRGAVQTAYMQV